LYSDACSLRPAIDQEVMLTIRDCWVIIYEGDWQNWDSSLAQFVKEGHWRARQKPRIGTSAQALYI
jgi:hypothetical protein